MCQCGCSESPIEQAYELTRRCILGVKVYHGCEGCFQGLAVDLSIFDSPKVEWLEHLRGRIDQSVKPNEFGGTNKAVGIPIPIIDVESLREVAREIDEADSAETWPSLDDWLEEYGFDLLSGAARRFAEKQAKR